jgi:hypothetical protein
MIDCYPAVGGVGFLELFFKAKEKTTEQIFAFSTAFCGDVD